ncbi:pentatricopeptide repeat-containing protein At4g20740 [Durio zibethinus]|uniref:Pentatricopeptide repeat-containing protein At4g20740 n=1 Tax=Durio zibethinus TaxID=66656 RepID=A0A6P5Z208_DURZI|nr:pentatricopeptide repeat-containing protein At4g20740 [Durio zibethinus]
MPPKSFPVPVKPPKPYFFYGHRKPSQNRPVVYGGLFSNRQILKTPQNPPPHAPPFDLRKWDPHHLLQNPSPASIPNPLRNPKLSPIARFILDAFRKNQYTWGPPVVFELNKLRRVTASLVAEVLKVQNDPVLASKFFRWAGKQKGFKHNFASYNALAYCLNRNGRFRAADQLPELMDSQGKPPTEKQFEILIRMHADNNRGQRVYYVYQKMKTFGIKPRVFLYNRIMDALVKTGYLDLASSVYEDFRGDGLVEESITFMILIKGLCKVGRIGEMLEVLGRMREKLCKPDVFAYTAMVRILVSEGNLDGGLRVWKEMERDGVKPDVMAYVTIVAGLCKGGRVQEGYELFREMKKKGILIERETYGGLIEGFVKDGKLGSACDLLKDLIDSGYRADLGIYNSLIEGLCDARQVDRAYKLLQITIQEGLEPEFATVNPMLVAFAEMRRMDDFCRLLEKMQKLGFSVIDDLSKFFSFMVGKGERTVMAVQVLDELKVKGYSSVPIYNILMEALHKTGKVKQALSLFQEMKDLNFKPDSSTYSIAIICYVEDEDIKEACVCHNKIIEMSCVPSIDAYYSLAKGLCQIGEIDAAMMLVRDCLGNVTSGPMAFKYTLTILHACKSGAEKVMEVLNEMMQEGLPPDNIICSAIISGMCKYETVEEARKVFANLRTRKLLTEANTIVYDELLIEHMEKKAADLVLSGLKFFGLESKLKAKGSTLLSR